MDNKVTLLLFGVLFFLAAIGEVLGLYGIGTDSYIANVGLRIIRLAGIIIIVQNGTILKTSPYKQIIYFLFAIILTGTLLKIQHWPWGNLLLTSGLLSLSVVYTIRFLKKPGKSLPDVFKFLWVVVFCASATLKINHWPWGNELLDIQTILFLILLLSFLYQLMQGTKEPAKIRKD